MPPKQKEVKKGPTYKQGAPLKDLIPAEVKQPPREPKLLKYPENFTEADKKDGKEEQPFEPWPSEQQIKSTDFGVGSDKRFEDPHHEKLVSHIKSEDIANWKSMLEVQKYRSQQNQQQGQSSKEIDDHDGSKSVSNPKIPEGEEHEIETEKQSVVIETYLRDQTAEEQQVRLKEEAEKAEKAAKDKKKAKKQEPKQEGPVQVSDVKMCDVLVAQEMLQEGVWIGSQLQIIKLRNLVDTYCKEPIWRKIYPQENGVPQINKSGRYWVKLYYMGFPVKVQIDDRVPINFNSNEMLALSEKYHEKWTLILSKALIKYMSIAYPESEVSGSCLIFHALTGMISEELSLKNFKKWEKFNSIMSDSHYTKKDIFVSCYTRNDSKVPSNFIKSKAEAKDFFMLENSSYGRSKSPRKSSAHNFQRFGEQEEEGSKKQLQKQEYFESQIAKNYAYCIGDYFENGEFNMAFSKERSPKEMKLRQEYSELSKVSLGSKTREQKLEHRRKKKEIKEQLQVEEKKRMECINQEQTNYHFVKLLADLNVYCEFSEKEILLAKKCRLNKLNQPPNYEIPTEKEENKSSRSFSMIKTKEEVEVNPDIADFSALDNAQEPLLREDKGIWLKDLDLISGFTHLQVIYNPETFEEKTIEKVSSVESEIFTHDPSKEILVVEKLPESEEDSGPERKIELLLGINFQQTQKPGSSKPYAILQKFDFDQFSVNSNVTKLGEVIDSKYLSLSNQNNVFKIYTFSKQTYSLWVSSSSKFKLMSISEYLEEYEGYQKKSFTSEHPVLEEHNYHSIAKFHIKEESEEQNSLVLKTQGSNTALLKSLSYRLVETPSEGSAYVSHQRQGVVLKDSQRKYLAEEFTKIQIPSGKEYALIVEAFPQENIPEGSLQVCILSKNETILLEALEQIEPVKFIEKYKPNKYGLIFRERLFLNSINYQSFYVKLVEGEEVQSGATGDKKGAKKGAKEQSSGPQFIQKPFEGKRSLTLKLRNSEKVLYETKGINRAIIPSILLPKTEADSEYFLEAFFDLIEWPEAKEESEETEKICWVIHSFGTESVALVRDTKQEEREKATRQSWEDREPGRAERAKKSRARYLIQIKKQKGQELSQEEQNLISNPRLTKKQQQIEDEKKNDDKNKKGGKKDDKKGGKEVKKEEVEEKPSEVTFPKSIDNCASEIRTFIKTLEDYSVRHASLEEHQEPKIRSEEQIRALQQSKNLSEESRVGNKLRNVERRETIKLRERDRKDQLTLYLQELNSSWKGFWSKYTAWRNENLEKDRLRQEKERGILDLLSQEKPAVAEADLEKILSEYKELADYNEKLWDVLLMLKKNIRIANLSQKLAGHLAAWEVEDIKAIKEQIDSQRVEGFSAELLVEMAQLLEEVEKNPAIVQEKQNEAKKAKKGGKK